MGTLRLVPRTITQDDLEAARRLRDQWNARQRERGFTQETASDALGMTQGAVSQYLNGRLALGVAATIRFARFLNCQPTDIRPDYEHMLATRLSLEAYELATQWDAIPPDDQMKVYSRNLIVDYPNKKGEAG